MLLSALSSTIFAETIEVPQRIASCSLATDEISLELLKRSHHEHRLIAVSRLADSADYSNIRPVPKDLKGRCGTELESLLSLKPDLILLAPYTRAEFVHQVKSAKIAIFTTEKPDSLEKIEKTIEDLGVRIREVPASESLLKDFRAQRASFQGRRDQSKKSPRLLHMFGDGSFSGAGTMFDAIAKELGAINVIAEIGVKGWPKLSLEQIVTLNPDLVVLAGAPQDQPKTLKSLQSIPGVKELAAVREGRVVLIPEPELGAVSHHVLKAIEKLSQAIRNIR
jgi:iron complex transport system substrate-binding protein